ncbi:endonuclease I family protein [Stackebrandtia nassauensis]|nr:endonuclease [Stackebrandtia nassauensis]
MRRTRTLAALAGAAVGATALILVPLATAQGHDAYEPPDGYYDAVEGMTGEELKAGLNDIISNNEQLSYDEARDALKETDADPADPSKVVLIYNGTSVPADDYDQWNREHVWAKSHGDFGTDIGPGTDVHHLRPANAVVNSTRNNLDFDMGGEEVADAPGNFYDSDSFEPRDEDKGDVARMILYMAVRYEGEDSYPDLEPNDEVENNEKPLHGRLSVLKQWNEQDPPSDFEKNRNEVIFEKFQKNRNPFIDHPEWVGEVWA